MPTRPRPPLLALLLFPLLLLPLVLIVTPEVVRGLDLDLAPPDEGEFIRDLAGMIDDADAVAIRETCASLLKRASTPIIVVTIPSMSAHGGDGYTIERFARELFDQWGIGELRIDGRDWNKGILLLVSREDRQTRIELGAGWGRGQDWLCREIMDGTIIPSFKWKKASQGIRAGVLALAAMAREEELPPPPQADVPALETSRLYLEAIALADRISATSDELGDLPGRTSISSIHREEMAGEIDEEKLGRYFSIYEPLLVAIERASRRDSIEHADEEDRDKVDLFVDSWFRKYFICRGLYRLSIGDVTGVLEDSETLRRLARHRSSHSGWVAVLKPALLRVDAADLEWRLACDPEHGDQVASLAATAAARPRWIPGLSRMVASDAGWIVKNFRAELDRSLDAQCKAKSITDPEHRELFKSIHRRLIDGSLERTYERYIGFLTKNLGDGASLVAHRRTLDEAAEHVGLPEDANVAEDRLQSIIEELATLSLDELANADLSEWRPMFDEILRVTLALFDKLMDDLFPQVHYYFTAEQLRGVAIALRGYYHDHGRYPEKLGDLPSLEDLDVIDRVDGKPLRYRVTDSGFLLWSIGGDGDDDGGRVPEGEDDGGVFGQEWRGDGDWVIEFPPRRPGG